MKFEYVKKIVEKIQQDIICPKCKKRCEDCSIELQSAHNNTLEFYTSCPHCDANMRIAAEVHFSQTQTHISRPRPKTHFLSIKGMKDMKSTLQNFRGDVRDLFS